MTPKHLGQSSPLPASPAAAILDYVPNPRPGRLLADLYKVPIPLALGMVALIIGSTIALSLLRPAHAKPEPPLS